MPARQVVIGSSVGLHARPASLFTQAAAQAAVPVTIAREGGDPVDARSILLVLSLGVKHGETVTLAAEGEGADPALDDLASLLAQDLDAAPAGG
ncbi:HPr family phosphocarrier protein [Kineosporia sp. NBRC 101731]|uniref:HPr family phosphocarrier protein n=1 Tax=Kineosporia sp. NBRC 101731 TaxID=3032199 RepID=UPI0024A2DE21|nr:HPr family phosphocarrier protein [Kineosporia sp. NBRC 101731]GLY32266.1 phosphotransferase [Kineosporia sp. NBRC 101731]